MLIFILGIGMPSLLLGYLAFRGIKNDQALLEKDRLDAQRRASEQVILTTHNYISAVEQDYENVLFGTRDSSRSELRPFLEKFRLEHPAVEEVFVCQNFEAIRFPIAKLLYQPPGVSPRTAAKFPSSALSEAILAGERLEFGQNRYREALANYQRSLEQATDPQTRGELLNAIARIQKKSAHYQDAIKSYEIIAGSFGQIRSAGGIPLGAAARMELGSLHLAIANPIRSLKTSMDLYQALLNSEWALEESQYEFFIQNIRNTVREAFSRARPDSMLKSYENTFLALEMEEKPRRKVTERLLPFVRDAARDVAAKAAGNQGPVTDSPRRFALELERRTYLVSLEPHISRNGEEPKEVWGLLR